MALQLALDSATNDLVKLEGGGYLRVEDRDYTIQSVRTRLKTNLGQWLLDLNYGWLSFEEDYIRNPDIYGIEVRARNIILQTQGVKGIVSIEAKLEKRTLYLTFTALTIYGNISLVIEDTLQ